MQNVVIIFSLSASGKESVTVVPGDQAAKAGQLIHWTIVNEGSGVEKVQIEFDPPKNYFGSNPLGGQHYIIKELNGAQTIWGKAPGVGGGKTELQKYTVFGLDASGTTLVKEDPRIIVTEP